MQTAETIVAVNRDPDAPIAEFADLLVVGDLFEVGPAILAGAPRPARLRATMPPRAADPARHLPRRWRCSCGSLLRRVGVARRRVARARPRSGESVEDLAGRDRRDARRHHRPDRRAPAPADRGRRDRGAARPSARGAARVQRGGAALGGPAVVGGPEGRVRGRDRSRRSRPPDGGARRGDPGTVSSGHAVRARRRRRSSAATSTWSTPARPSRATRPRSPTGERPTRRAG